MLGNRPEADRILTAKLTGTAERHAKWRELSEAEHDAAVAGLRELAGGRAGLLAEVEMLERFGSNCAFTGPQPPQCLEAAHLYLYTKSPRHDLRGGLLLRRDLHSLFDRYLITIDPIDWRIDVSPELDGYEEIAALRGRPLKVPTRLRATG